MVYDIVPSFPDRNYNPSFMSVWYWSHNVILMLTKSTGLLQLSTRCVLFGSVAKRIIVYLCKYFPRLRAFLILRAEYRVYAQASRHSRGVVANACAFLAYTGAHQVENIYKDGLYSLPIMMNPFIFNQYSTINLSYVKKNTNQNLRSTLKIAT